MSVRFIQLQGILCPGGPMNMITYNGRPDLQRFNAEWQIHQQPNFAATPHPPQWCFNSISRLGLSSWWRYLISIERHTGICSTSCKQHLVWMECKAPNGSNLLCHEC